ncbi:MAG: oligopeptide transporter, OPT family [Planctomycetaceae bacterium]
MPQPHRELTPTSVILGLVLAVIMGAANVYLGLKVGMTISASIPAAVIAMAVLHGVMGRRSVLEANQVQTAATSGESLAAGIIFTIPAFLIAGVWTKFDYWTTTWIGLAGGLLGVLLMIPMRRVFVVGEKELPFPEAVACAEVLRTAEEDEQGQSNQQGARVIFTGLAVGGAIKFVQTQLGLLQSGVEWAGIVRNRILYVGTDIAPALIAVGVIVGLPISAQIFTGGVIGSLIAIPLLSDSAEPAETVLKMAAQVRKGQVGYIGVGAMIVGGLVSIWHVRGGLVAAVRELSSQFGKRSRGSLPDETERDIGTGPLLCLTVATVVMIAGIYYSLLGLPGITLLTTAIMLVLAFFFTAVASYIVGLVGSSNSPVSGMAISAILATAGLIGFFNWTGWLRAEGDSAILATLGVAGIICCVACMAGDACNDLKTGYLVGSSPRRQQIMEVLAVVVSAFVMAPVMTMLHVGAEQSGGIGGTELKAPQAALIAALVRGIFGGKELPWDMIAWGVGIGVAIIFADLLLKALGFRFRLHVMPVAVGIYLPFGIAPPILIGGLMHYALTRRRPSGIESRFDRGVLVASGVIAGESLVGVLLGGLRAAGGEPWKPGKLIGVSEPAFNAISLMAFAGVAAWMFWMSLPKPERRE